MPVQPSRMSWWFDALETDCLRIAHRGASAYAPENTLPAFELALRMGADMFELDVHLTADGEVVVFHDDDVLRLTDAAERFPDRSSFFVSDFTLAELQSLDAGVESAVRIPTLLEVLELAEEHMAFVNIELKLIPRGYRQLASQVFACLERVPMPERVLITSFDHRALVDVRAYSDKIATGVLSSDRLANVAEYLELLDADAYHPSCDVLGVSAADGELDTATIAALRTRQKHINVWTCNEPADMQRLLDAGVTGIITDYPDRLRDVMLQRWPTPAF